MEFNEIIKNDEKSMKIKYFPLYQKSMKMYVFVIFYRENNKKTMKINENIKNQLAALASRVQESKEYVLIYARNDAEGRWVYQQMREASEDYRLRGNIKRHKKPRIVLDAPLE